MSASTPTARSPQISALTTTRGLAAWWVALYHFREYLPVPYNSLAGGFIAQGYYALDLFFVLSGFVLQINYAPGMSRLTWQSLRAFAVARFGRIYPLHLFMLLIYPLVPLCIWLFSRFGNLEGRYTLEYYLLSLVLLQNWGLTSELTWNVPAWSISTEFAAYLCFPIAAVGIMRLRSLPAALAATAFVLAVIAGLFLLFGVRLSYYTVRYGLPRCVLEFFVGMCVGRLYQLGGAPGLWPATAMLAAALAGVAAVLREWVADYYLLPAAYAAMILALTCPRGIVIRMLNWRWLVYLGEVSYATYLSHFFIREVIKFALPSAAGTHWGGTIAFLLATLMASIVLYHFVELPSRSYIRRLGTARRAGAEGVAYPGGGLAGAGKVNRRDSGA